MIELRSFPATPESVPTARRFVTTLVAGSPQEIIDRAGLLVSELASNAVRHAGSDFVLRLEQTPDQLEVEVTDKGPGSPVMQTPEARDLSGRGLRIVDILADSWGVRPSAEGGKSVWFILALGPDKSVASNQGAS